MPTFPAHGRLHPHVETLRPYTLWYVGLVGLAGAGLAADHRPGWRMVAAWAAPTLGWVAGLYGGDYFDRHLDAIAKPHRPIPSGRLAPRAAVTAMVGCVVAGSAVALLVNWRSVVLVASALVVGIAYSTVFKARGLSGNVVRGGLMGYAFLFGAMATSAVPDVRLLAGAALFWLHDAGSNLVGTLRDVDGDRAGGYGTFPVRHGTGATLVVLAVLYGCWVVVAVTLPGVLGRTAHVSAYGALLAVAVSGGGAAVALLVRAPRPLAPRTALGAHEILVVERVLLAGAVLALGVGAGPAVPLTLLGAGASWVAQRGMRTQYELGSPAGRGRPRAPDGSQTVTVGPGDIPEPVVAGIKRRQA